MNLFNFYEQSLTQEFEISVKSHWKTLDLSSQRCLTHNEPINTMQCIKNYFINIFGCYGSACYRDFNDSEKMTKYVNISKKLQNSGADEIFKLTGCLAACEQNEFQIKELGPLKSEEIMWNGTQIKPPSEMRLQFYFPRGEWEEQEQVSRQSNTSVEMTKHNLSSLPSVLRL